MEYRSVGALLFCKYCIARLPMLNVWCLGMNCVLCALCDHGPERSSRCDGNNDDDNNYDGNSNHNNTNSDGNNNKHDVWSQNPCSAAKRFVVFSLFRLRPIPPRFRCAYYYGRHWYVEPNFTRTMIAKPSCGIQYFVCVRSRWVAHIHKTTVVNQQ